MFVYAPQAGCSENGQNDFHLTLGEAIKSVPEGRLAVVEGDEKQTLKINDVARSTHLEKDFLP